MSLMLDKLLRPEIPNVAQSLPTGQYKLKRLSELLGEDVVVTLRSLPYGRVQEIREMGTEGDTELQIVLAGLVDPDPKAQELKERFGGATPAETLKAFLLPGEIVDMSRAIERLSGYRMETIEQIKND